MSARYGHTRVVMDAGASAAVSGSPSGVLIAQGGTGQLERTMPLVFSYDETTDVGRDKAGYRHLVSPEDRWRVAMARQ